MGAGAVVMAPAERFLTQGHPGALRFIQRAIEEERPPHALLLGGPRGVGKTTLALDLAAGLLCLADDPSQRPCRACSACRKVVSDNHPDLHRIEPAGAGEQIRLGQVQQLNADLSLSAMEGRFRVALVSAAQRLNPDAQNALLKTLEEPGAGTCLILCADDVSLLLPTVLSRVARIRVSPLPIGSLATQLAEAGIADPALARGLAIAAAGRPGLARRLAGHPEAVLSRGRIARRLLDLHPADRRTRLGAAGDLVADGAAIDAGVRGEVASTSSKLQPVERRRAVTAVLEVWRDLGRDLAVAIHGGRGLRDLELLEELSAAAPSMDPGQLRRFLDRLDGMIIAIEGYAAPELVLDALLLAWPRPRGRASGGAG